MAENSWSAGALNYAAFAIPAFFFFVGLEYFIACRNHRQHVFRFDSSVANLSIGVAERLLNLFLTASFYGAFEYIYQHFARWPIPNTWWVWVILILATDLVWYWYHRLGHEVNLFWAAHIVHHQSEEFNYTVSARITTLQAIVRNVFWCFLPLAGFHPSMVIVTLVVHGAYSFFTHTQIVRKLGWLESIFITPSHHRVHHASNEKYLNKNYGDLFVFWDKLFGTFQQEEERPVYGLTHPLKSYSFMWQHFHYFLEMAYAFRRTRGLKSKLRIIFGRPETLDQDIRAKLEQIYLPNRNSAGSSVLYRQYVTLQFVAVIILLFVVSLFIRELGVVDALASIFLVLITIINCGALLEQRTWIYHLEYIRLLLICGYSAYRIEQPAWFGITLLFIAILLWPIPSVKKWYLRCLYGE